MRTGQWAEDQLALGWCFGEPVTGAPALGERDWSFRPSVVPGELFIGVR